MSMDALSHIFKYQETADVKSILRELTLDQFVADLEKIRTTKQAPSDTNPFDPRLITPEDAQVITRQITDEVELMIDTQGSGKVLIGKQSREKRFAFFFQEGHSRGLRKILLPYHAPLVPTRNALPSKVKFLFINLKSEQYPLITAPLGIITLGAYLKHVYGDQVEVDYLDTQLETADTPVTRILCTRPDIVGLSVKIGEVQEMYNTIEAINSIDQDICPTIVLGNVIPTYASDEIHHILPNMINVIGRGEPAIKALAAHIASQATRQQLVHVPNSSFKIGSTIFQVDGTPFSLANLSVPDWAALFERYPQSQYQEVWLEASRGCPQKRSGVGCSFCAIMPNNDSRDWVSRPTTTVIEEIRHLSGFGIKHIRFADEEFMAGQTTQALELALQLKGLKEELQAKGVTMPTFDFAIRVDDVYKRGSKETQRPVETEYGTFMSNNDVRREALITFKEAGLTQVYLGIESGSFQQLKRMYKAVIPEDNARAVSILRELGLQVAGGWIMIDPLMEGLTDLKENITFLEEHQLIPSRPEDDFVTNPINRMRILEGSPFVDILRKRQLLGPRKGNLIEYTFSYKDEIIAQIAQMLDTWEEEVGPWQYALKNKVALGVLDQEVTSQLEHLSNHLFNLKKLDFRLLKEIVALFDEYAPAYPLASDLDTLITTFKTERRQIISRLVQDIDIVEDNAGTLKIGLRQIGVLSEC